MGFLKTRRDPPWCRCTVVHGLPNPDTVPIPELPAGRKPWVNPYPCYSLHSLFPATCCCPQGNLKISAIFCPMLHPVPLRQFIVIALPVPSRCKSCSSHVSTAHFRLHRFLNHFCSLVQVDSPICQCCRRVNETVEHIIMSCQVHAEARRALGWATGRDTHSLRKLLSNPGTMPHLLDYVAATWRFT